MNLDELQSVQSRERQTDSLQQLRASFYEDAAEFVQELREEREKAAERAEDPFDSPDVNRLSDDIRTAEQTVEAIYERRVGKVVKMASLAAADMPTEQEGLTKEERELFETMVTAIEDHRERILDVLGGEAPTGAVSSQSAEEREASAAIAARGSEDAEDDALDAAAVMGEGSEAAEPSADESVTGSDAAETGTGDPGTSDPGTDDPSPDDPSTEGIPPSPDGAEGAPDTPSGEPSSDADEIPGEGQDGDATGNSPTDDDAPEDDDPGDSAPDDDGASDAATDRVTVRITEDVGEIFGVDEREYDLAADDVVTLPATNAEPLIDRDAAEPLE